MKRVRWLVLGLGTLILTVAYSRGELRDFWIAFGIGITIGFLIDLFGIRAKLWHYYRQPFLSWKYFLIAIPAWGILAAAINLTWDWMTGWLGLSLGKTILVFVIITFALLLFHELPNLLFRSWKYNAPSWLVIAGWFPMVFSFRLIFILID
jgi:hypothetical protein